VHRQLLAEQKVSVRPLSVSSDTIAVIAFRCARLLTMHGERGGVAFDRTGQMSRVFDVYPAAALASWGFPSDHALDAFLSALAARAAGQRRTTVPQPDQRELARTEGWIHVPRPESFEGLDG